MCMELQVSSGVEGKMPIRTSGAMCNGGMENCNVDGTNGDRYR